MISLQRDIKEKLTYQVYLNIGEEHFPTPGIPCWIHRYPGSHRMTSGQTGGFLSTIRKEAIHQR